MKRYQHGGDHHGGPPISLDFSVNTNPLGMPEAVQRALQAKMPLYSRYPDPNCRELRAGIAAHHGIDPEQILCGNGAADLIFRVALALRPRLALIPAPTFSEYERPIKLMGGEVREHLLSVEKQFRLGEDFLEALKPEIDLVIICNPNNPVGNLVDPALLVRVAERCRELDIHLMIDECFIELAGGKSLVSILQQFPKLIILRAFTKQYAMAGLRLGYLLASAELVEFIKAYGAEWSVSIPAQVAGIAALGCEPDWSVASLALICKERTRLVQALTELSLEVFPSEANFLLLKGPQNLAEQLKLKALAIRDCSNFTGLESGYFRIGIKTEAENERLLNAIREIIYG